MQLPDTVRKRTKSGVRLRGALDWFERLRYSGSNGGTGDCSLSLSGGTRLGSYEILVLFAAGGMGELLDLVICDQVK